MKWSNAISGASLVEAVGIVTLMAKNAGDPKLLGITGIFAIATGFGAIINYGHHFREQKKLQSV